VEITAALKLNGKSVTMIFQGAGIGGRLFPRELALLLNGYYLDEGRVRGVLLWNVWEQVDAARQLLAEPGPVRASELRGRLPLGVPQDSHAG
jgi:NADPH-dependent 2,4-dienoyl-CoA reductase/sulfur reductase-like enzyme